MSNASARWQDLDSLLDRVLDGLYSEEDSRRLNDVLRSDVEACRHYVAYVELHGRLSWGDGIRAGSERGASCEGLVGDGRGMAGLTTIDLAVGAPAEQSVGAAVELPYQHNVELPHQPGTEIPDPEPLVPPIVLDLSPTSHYPLSASHFYVGGPVFSYMVATVIVGVMLLSAWAYKITHYNQIAATPSVPSNARPELVFVGRITGMVDCRWADPSTEAFAGAYVPLDRKYALASGLMQITYDSGAKVILQGPCTYEVESRAGGYLSLGKLTAKVQKGLGVRDQGSEEVNPTFPGPWPLTPDPFCVRTPTAVVTDLGTEFGVEVSEEGNTTSHVFRGSVKVQVVGRNGRGQDVVLRASESARVERGEGADGPQLVLHDAVGSRPKFARRLVEPPKVLDLLDVVAGGTGLGQRRERGINPATGREAPVFIARGRSGDGKYWPVAWHKLIDGVFVPHGGAGPVQLDSAEHTFDGFLRTSGQAFGSVWSRAADIKQPDRGSTYWVYALGRGEQFMPESRGLLCLHANAGITFNLAAIRKAYPDVRPTRFRAVGGLAPSGLTNLRSLGPRVISVAGLWVFVDGQLQLQQARLRPESGPVDVNVELSPDQQFLTLVSTGRNQGISYAWVVFGDPVLEMTLTDSEKPARGDTKQVKRDSQTEPENRKP